MLYALRDIDTSVGILHDRLETENNTTETYYNKQTCTAGKRIPLMTCKQMGFERGTLWKRGNST